MYMIPLAVHLDEFSLQLPAASIEQRSEFLVCIEIEDFPAVLQNKDQRNIQFENAVPAAG